MRLPINFVHLQACTIGLLVVMTGWTIAAAEYAWTGDKVWGRVIIV